MADSPTVPDPISRRALAAIVFTDIVGYSARMSANETATLKACQSDLGIMHQICKEGKGQVLKSTGDGLLMYFASAVDAVRCALLIQQRITEDAKKLPPGGALLRTSVMATHDRATIDRALERFATVKQSFEAEHGPLPGPGEH